MARSQQAKANPANPNHTPVPAMGIITKPILVDLPQIPQHLQQRYSTPT
jgi:hypothetical protein